MIAEVLGLNVVELIKAARIGYNRTNLFVPSPGVGGACLTKDPYIFRHVARGANHDSDLISIGRKINEYMPQHVANKVKQFLKNNNIRNPKLFIMGFAFKGHPVTSDMRFSPTLDLVEALKDTPSRLYGYDEAVPAEEIQGLGIQSCSIAEGFQEADAVIVMLNNNLYSDLDIFELLATANKPMILYDSWQMYKPGEIRRLEGVTHIGVGYV